jgi:chromosome segregation ATPase
MIVSLAENIRAQLAQLRTLEQRSQAEQDVAKTRDALRKARRAAADLQQSYELLAPRLDEAQLKLIRQPLAGLPAEVRRLQAEFDVQPYQVAPLEQLKRQLDAAAEQLNTVWIQAAEQQVAPQVALLRLLRQLPEMAPRAAELRQLIDDLTRPLAPPWSAEKLASFDNRLTAARALVEKLPELSPDVESFLRRVAADQATVDDLNPEALRWLKSGGRARLFRIRIETQ